MPLEGFSLAADALPPADSVGILCVSSCDAATRRLDATQSLPLVNSSAD